jgi:hypothetical protein
MTVNTICTNAISTITGYEVPSSFVGNTNKTAKDCIANLIAAGQTLEREHRWTELIATHTFTTTAAVAGYDLPSDFRAFANMSQWDRTNQLSMLGPTSPSVWQWLQSGIASGGVTIQRWFRIQRGQLFIYPTPTVTGDTIVFDYYSKNWVNKGGGVYDVTFSSDNNTTLLDEHLLTLDLKWRFLQAKGMPFQAEYAEFESIKTSLIEDNGGKGIINLGRPRLDLSNLPETNFGGGSP